MPAWNRLKQAAMTSAVFLILDRVVVPITSETAKQSIESPIPIRMLVRRSMDYGLDWGGHSHKDAGFQDPASSRGIPSLSREL
jgi:hypothetical protein